MSFSEFESAAAYAVRSGSRERILFDGVVIRNRSKRNFWSYIIRVETRNDNKAKYFTAKDLNKFWSQLTQKIRKSDIKSIQWSRIERDPAKIKQFVNEKSERTEEE